MCELTPSADISGRKGVQAKGRGLSIEPKESQGALILETKGESSRGGGQEGGKGQII